MGITTERGEVLRTLLAQVQGAVAFLEEVLDEDFPGWDQPRRGRSGSPAGGSSVRNAYGQLSMAWINLASTLSKEPGVEVWDIEPFISRSQEGEGMSRWEFGPNGLELTEQESMRLEWRSIPSDAVRVVEKSEPRYTLAEAKELLLRRSEAQHQALMGAPTEHDQPHDREEQLKLRRATPAPRDE